MRGISRFSQACKKQNSPAQGRKKDAGFKLGKKASFTRFLLLVPKL